jgi:hypothetical protein
LGHCDTSRKVVGLVPDGGTVALGSTGPLIDMTTRNISWGVNAAGA